MTSQTPSSSGLQLPPGPVLTGPAGPWLTRRKAAEVLHISESTLDRLIKVGELPSRRMGNRVLIPARAIYANA